MKNRILAALVALLVAATPPTLLVAATPPTVRAQGGIPNGGFSSRVVQNWDPSSSTETFCALGPSSPGTGTLNASASSTVTAAAGTPFDPVAVGDELTIKQGPDTYIVGVSARASSTSITAAYQSPSTLAAANLTLAAAAFEYRTQKCGTTADFGWFSVGKGPFTVAVTVWVLTSTSIEWRLYCRTTPQDGPNQIYPVDPTTPKTVSTADTKGFTVTSADPWTECRVGFKVNSDVTGDRVRVSVTGRAM